MAKKNPTVTWIVDNVLGGSKKASEYLCVTPTAVSNMKSRGRFPKRHRPKILKVCKSAGVEYDPSMKS